MKPTFHPSHITDKRFDEIVAAISKPDYRDTFSPTPAGATPQELCSVVLRLAEAQEKILSLDVFVSDRIDATITQLSDLIKIRRRTIESDTVFVTGKRPEDTHSYTVGSVKPSEVKSTIAKLAKAGYTNFYTHVR